MSLARNIHKYRRYAGASLILLVVIWMATTVGQTGAPPDSTTGGSRFNLLGPAGLNLAAKGGVQGSKKNAGSVGPIVSKAVKSDTSASLRSIRMVPPQKRHRHEANEADDQLPGRKPGRVVKDDVVQKSFGSLAMPTAIASFEGMTNPNGYEPPDTNGDVGPNHYVQTVNASFQIWNKSGTSLYGPADTNTLWTGFGGLCESTNDGDPQVLYDPLADRWLITQFAFADSFSPVPSHQCLAVSTTADPTGSYHRYDFLTAGQNQDLFGDYPHLGVWPDGYYMTTNEFRQNGFGFDFAGAGNFAFERARMLTGDPTARMVYFDLPTEDDGGMLPSDLDGAAPPAGTPNYFVEPFNDANGELHEYKFHVDWANTANSTFTGPTVINVAPWAHTLCPASRGACIDQPNSFVQLEAVADRFMNRLAYRNMGSYEALVVNNTANADGNGTAGIRWYEIRNPNGTPVVFQQSTYSPSSDHRWMGSIAMDHVGNIAVGYSVSNATDIYPSIRYAGRLVTDPLNTLAQGEGTLIAGSGEQSGSARWGDYSSMSVDPVDDCTFWFTTEYYGTQPIFDTWQTRIGSFKFPSCTQGTPTPTVTGTPPTNTRTPTVTLTFTRTRTPTITPTPCGDNNYTIGQSTGATIVPGTTLVAGSQGDEVLVSVPLPFTYSFYGQAFSSVNVSSNGNLQFTSNTTFDYFNSCLPDSSLNNAILAYWDDLVTSDTGGGIFTSTTGSAPNRVFNIEWRASIYFSGENLDFEVRLYEGQSRFDIVYGALANGGDSATVGAQNGTGANFTEFECNQLDSLSAGLQLTFALPTCASATPTNTQVVLTSTRTNTPTTTRTPTNTPTNTVTSTRTNTPTNTRTNTPTSTPTNIATNTVTSTRTNTPTNTPTNTSAPTNTATSTRTNTPTNTPSSTPTSTATSTVTRTFTGVPSNTSTPIQTTPASNTPTRTPTRTITPGAANLVGHITWQGRPAQPNALQQLPLTLTLRLASGGPDNEYTGLSTDSSGYFTVPMGSLPTGTYNWRVKGPVYLANAGTVGLTGAPTTSAEMGVLRPGDCNNDNLVSSPDFIVLKNTFGKGNGDPGYDGRADFTGDNTVNAADFTLLKSSFGSGGAPPPGP